MSGVIYCLIAVKGDVVVCEYAPVSGNFMQFSRVLLNKEIEPNCSKILSSQNKSSKFYYINENEVTFMCMGQDTDDSTSFCLLIDLKAAFYKKYEHSAVISAKAYEYNNQFSPEIKKIMEYYDSAPRKSIGGEVIKTLSDVKKIMSKNIQELLDREGNILLTAQSAQSLKDHSVTFNGYVS